MDYIPSALQPNIHQKPSEPVNQYLTFHRGSSFSTPSAELSLTTSIALRGKSSYFPGLTDFIFYNTSFGTFAQSPIGRAEANIQTSVQQYCEQEVIFTLIYLHCEQNCYLLFVPLIFCKGSCWSSSWVTFRARVVASSTWLPESEIGWLGSVNLLLFFRSPSPVRAEQKNEINKFSRTLTTQFRTLVLIEQTEVRYDSWELDKTTSIS